MTVAPVTTETVYDLIGAALGPFATVWDYETAADVGVWLDNGPLSTGRALLTSGAQYTLVDGVGVTLDPSLLTGGAWPAGAVLTLARTTAVDQPSGFGEAARFSPSDNEAAIDHLAREIQDLRTLADRSIKLYPGDSDYSLPLAASRANLFLGFDGTGAPVLLPGAGGGGILPSALGLFALSLSPGDQHAANQAVFNAVKALGGGIAYALTGTSAFATPLSHDGSTAFALQGAGWGSVLRYTGGGNVALSFGNAAANQTADIRIGHFLLQGGGVALVRMQQALVDRVRIFGAPGDAISNDRGYATVVRDAYLANGLGHGYHALPPTGALGNDNLMLVRGHYLANAAGKGAWIEGAASGGHGDGGDYEGNLVGFQLDAGSGSTQTEVFTFDRNYIENAIGPSALFGTDAGSRFIRGLSVSSNIFNPGTVDAHTNRLELGARVVGARVALNKFNFVNFVWSGDRLVAENNLYSNGVGPWNPAADPTTYQEPPHYIAGAVGPFFGYGLAPTAWVNRHRWSVGYSGNASALSQNIAMTVSGTHGLMDDPGQDACAVILEAGWIRLVSFTVAAGQTAGLEMLRVAGADMYLGGGSGSESLHIYRSLLPQVNRWAMKGNSAGLGVSLNTDGADANVSGSLIAKGVSLLNFQNGDLTAPTTHLVVGGPVLAVNYVGVQGAISGFGVSLYAAGGDANIGVFVTTKGTGHFTVQNNAAGAPATLLDVTGPTTAANYLTVTASIAGAPAIGTSAGDLALSSFTGLIQFASAASFTANGAVATALTGVGPAGAHTTAQEWLTFKNAAGTTRYVPAF